MGLVSDGVFPRQPHALPPPLPLPPATAGADFGSHASGTLMVTPAVNITLHNMK